MQTISHRSRKFILVMTYIDDTFTLTLGEFLNNSLYALLIFGIKAVERLVENKQRGVFYKCSRQQCQTLLTTRQLHKGTLLQMGYSKEREPPFATAKLLGRTFHIKSYAVVQTRRHNINGWDKVNLSVGGELELSNNFGGADGFYARPALGAKWTF